MAKSPDVRGIYFNSDHLGEPALDYVCWLDVMGTQNQMLRSLPISANFIFKLQCAVLEAYEEGDHPPGLRLYPVMDGCYITSDRREPLRQLLNQALVRLAMTFLEEPKPYHQFLVRGAIAFGPVYHGCDVDSEAAHVLGRHQRIPDSMLLGLPMAQAYGAERLAPPFGVCVHESARAIAPPGDRPFRFIWLDWYKHSDPAVDPGDLLASLHGYFNWQEQHCNMTGYALDRIAHHRQLADEFLTD